MDPKEALEQTEDVVRSRVEAYVNSLPTEMANLSKPESPVTPRWVSYASLLSPYCGTPLEWK